MMLNRSSAIPRQVMHLFFSLPVANIYPKAVFIITRMKKVMVLIAFNGWLVKYGVMVTWEWRGHLMPGLLN